MKKTAFLLLFICLSSFAQKSIHNYKYIIVPEKFDFFKKPDKYQTSSLTKFLFEKNGFKVLLGKQGLPQEVFKNRCLALDAVVIDNSTMFMTKNTIELRNCKNDLVFKSLEGTSKQKDFKKSYHEALRNAFKSIAALKYAYKPVLEPVFENGKKTENTYQKHNLNSVTKDNEKSNVSKRDVSNKEKKNNPFNSSNRIPVLYATPTNEGFQLLNERNQIVFNLLETKLKNVFVVKDKNGIIYKEDNIWMSDFYDTNGDKVVKQYDIRVQQ